MHLYPGPGFRTGLVLLAIYALTTAILAVAAIAERSLLGFAMSAACSWYVIDSWKSFYHWFKIPPNQLMNIEGELIQFKNRLRLAKGVKKIMLFSQITKKSLNFMPAGKDFRSVMKLIFADGTSLLVRAGQGPATSFSVGSTGFGAADVAMLHGKCALIMACSSVHPTHVEFDEIVR
ncbi:hypothetical protein [Novosphingobium sp. AAP93]|uniref:hypothetical protein n=1 Tax=Novosphingobium sp. AAP93 TaxID=1523427 RepID=UPI0012E1060F|nr:hypothetical protein [Novosphingobium sp. AAP93]